MANKLAAETSPYLRQHADNPVDWFPWGDDAFAEARRRGVPIFLSVGYSSCHWCHVMAHESFEDASIAALVNDAFVSVKVDREERPDVDAVYMQAVQALTGRGGWPMSVFLTPDGEPFYAGTYWPKEAHHGLPSFPQVVEAVADAWRNRRGEVTESAASIAATLAAHVEGEVADHLDVGVVDDAAATVLERAWDRRLGGFGSAPKFPQAMTIEWLLDRHARTGDDDAAAAAVQALDAMARGGIHDQLAGGFARYATDAAWLVPHFEKMLYDNALLLAAYASATALTGRADLRRVTHSTAGYLLTELRNADGVFHSATDADTDGREGLTFVWPYDELVDVLTAAGEDAALWCAHLGAVPGGNWEGVNILHEPVPRERFVADRGLDPAAFEADRERVRHLLLDHRSQRPQPGVDDKILCDWNALAIRGLVRAGTLLAEPAWIDAATVAAGWLHANLVVDGRLHHVAKDGRVAVPGFLEDHALLALADLELYCATGEVVWFERAVELAETADRRFRDDTGGGWFQTADDAERLYTRPKETWDNATPAGTSVLLEVSRILFGLTGEARWRDRVEHGLRAFQAQAATMATGYGWYLRQVEAEAAGPREVAVVGADGPRRDALVRVAARPRPGTVTVVSGPDHGDTVPLLRGRGEVDGAPAAYVCRQLACDAPVTSPDDLERLLADGP